MNIVRLRRRIQALEIKTADESIMLLMPDGRTETLPGHNDYVLNLFSRALRGDRTPEVELIARSVSSVEPSGAHMIDLARALLNSPSEAASETSDQGDDERKSHEQGCRSRLPLGEAYVHYR